MRIAAQSSQRGSTLFLIIFLIVALFASLLAALFVASNTQVSIRQGQTLHRSLADQARIKALLLALIADTYEVAPASAENRALSTRLQDAVASLQGGGTWSIVSQPLAGEFPPLAQFPRLSVPTTLAELGGENVDEAYLTPELHALIAPGVKVFASKVMTYQFHRLAEQAREFRFSVRLLAFPLLRAPHVAEVTTENRIVYWQASDLRRDLGSSFRAPHPSAQLALWHPQPRFLTFAARSLSRRQESLLVHDTVRLDLGSSAEDDPSLLCRFGPSLGVLSDEAVAGALPWSFRERAAIWVNAPAYVFSDTQIKDYLNYCGRSHVFNLESPIPSALDGIEKMPVASASIDVAHLSDHLAPDSPLYNPSFPAAVVFSEHDGNVTLTDSSDSSSLAPLTLVLAGPSDLSLPPLQITVSTSLTRPLVIFLYHAELRTTGVVTVNGALYCDPESIYTAASSSDLSVASLIYYGGTEAKSHWNRVIANRPIPESIEAIAPRVILPVIKAEPL